MIDHEKVAYNGMKPIPVSCKTPPEKHTTRENPSSTIKTEEYLVSNGVTSLVGGMFSVKIRVYTVKPSRIVITSDTLSPDSGGRKNANTTSTPRAIQGSIRLLI